jgi:allophanate hydrolase subunit 2
MKTGFGGHYLRTFCTRFKLSRIGQWPVHKHKRFTRVIVKQETKQKRNRNETKQAETKRNKIKQKRNEPKRDTTETKRNQKNHQ